MIKLLSGDCRDVLATLPAESVQCVMTSPPYYALRSYLDAAHPDKHREIGSEPTPDEYLATMVGVFREVRRVLRRDGTCWVNMGDSYSDGGTGANDRQRNQPNAWKGARDLKAPRGTLRGANRDAKPKDLLLMPARLALALQADGWWVRSAITWCKPSPMPESCTDRPTSATEMVYLLTKSAHYFYDSIAIREDAVSDHPSGNGYKRDPRLSYGGRGNDEQWNGIGGTRNARNWWVINSKPFPQAHFATFPPELAERCIKAGTSERGCCAACGKPWVRVTERGALVMRSENDGNGYVLPKMAQGDRLSRQRPETGFIPNGRYETTTTGWAAGCQCNGHFEERPAAPDWISDETGERKMVRVWVPDGDAPPPVPCTVLDPFAGAGTTLLVADRQQRDCIGIDLNVGYTRMAMDRCIADAPLFTSFAPAEPPEDERMADLFTDMAAD